MTRPPDRQTVIDRSIGQADRIERQARRFLWLFPAWMRSTRGQEAIALTLDLLGTTARRLTWSARWHLLRAGLHARRIGTPPPSIWMRVAWAEPARSGAYVGTRWRPWLIDNLERRWFYLRLNLVRVPTILVPTFVLTSQPGSGWFLLIWLLAATGISAMPLRWAERKQWLYLLNGHEADGHPIPSYLLAEGTLPARVPNLAARWVAVVASVPAIVLAVGGRALRDASGPFGFLQPWDPAAATPSRSWVLLLPPALAGVVALRTLRLARHHAPAATVRLRGRSHWLGAAITLTGWSAAVAGYGMLLAQRHSGVGAVASIALASAVVWLVILVAEAIVERRIGVWDLLPALGPRARIEWAPPRYPDLPPPPPVARL